VISLAAGSLSGVIASAQETATLNGNLAVNGGVALATWSGGLPDDLVNTARAAGCNLLSVWANRPTGGLVGYIPTTVQVVNQPFQQAYPDGILPAGPVLVVCREGVAPPPTTTPSATPTPAATPPVAVGGIGDSVQHGPLDITVISAGMFDSTQFNPSNVANFRVQVRVVNQRGTSTETVNWVDFKLFDQSGFVGTPMLTCQGCPDPFGISKMPPGSESTGYLYFRLAEGSQAVALVHEPLYSGDQVSISLQ
jgi:hypothetical protein